MSSRYGVPNFFPVTVPPPNLQQHGGNASVAHQQAQQHQNINVASAVVVQAQKNNLVNQAVPPNEYNVVMNHQQASHQHGGIMNHSTYRGHLSNNSYHVTSASPSYATQSGPHQQQQSSTGPNSLRTPSSSSASTSQAHPHQDHKMQPQQQQQQSQQPQVPMHSSYQQRQQQPNYARNPNSGAMQNRAGGSGASGLPNNIVNNGNNAGTVIPARQNAQPHQQQVIYQQSPVLVPFSHYSSQRNIAGFVQASNQFANGMYGLPQPYSYLVHRPGAGASQNLQAGAPMGANVGAVSVGGTNSQQHQQSSQHQAQINQHAAHYLPQAAVNPTPINVGSGMGSMYAVPAPPPKAAKKILEIIDPNTGQNIMEKFTSEKASSKPNSGGSGSSALSIDPPIPPQVTGSPALNIPPLEVSHDIVAPHAPAAPSTGLVFTQMGDAVTIEQCALDVPQPHTPVVSAIADGPSVDIPPKQSKNVKRNNKYSDGQHSAALTIEKPSEQTAVHNPQYNRRASQTDTGTQNSSIGELSHAVVTSTSNATSSSAWVKTQTKATFESAGEAHTSAAAPTPSVNKYKQPNTAVHQTVAHNKMKDRSAPAGNPGAGPKESQGSENLDTSTNSVEVASRVPSALTHSSDPNAIANIDRNKNLINNENQPPLENNLTNANSDSSISQKLQPPQAEVNIVSNVGSTIADDEKDSIENSCNTISSNCLPVKGSSADETDRATETNLDSVLNIKNNNNIMQNKTNTTTPTTATTPTTPATATTAKTINSVEGTEEIEPVSVTYENTKDNQNSTVPSNQDADVKNGSTDSINTINNNKNATVDKDLDNNDVTTAETELLAENNTETDDSVETKVPTSTETASDESQSQASTKSVANKSLTKLSYNEGQWSPDNVDGRKFYVREQLLTLQHAPASMSVPQILDKFQLFIRKSNNNFMPSFASNNKNQSSSGSRNTMFNKRPSTQGQQIQQGGKGSKQGMIHVTLSLRQDVKLNEATNAWKPSFMNSAPADESSDVEILCRKVRGILNKLTPEKFEPLLEQIQTLNIDTQEQLSGVINLVFEKAIDEPNFAFAYAMLCKNVTKSVEDKQAKENSQPQQGQSKQSEQNTFKKELVNKCQKEFEQHVTNNPAMEQKLRPLSIEMENTTDLNRKLELKAQLQEEESKFRRRSVGTVRFIGELYRQCMLTTTIIYWCASTLLDQNSEEKLECLCKLLTTVGHKLEEFKNDPAVDRKQCRDLALQFQRMQNIADDKKLKISSRVRFMLLDLIELRKNKWVPKRNELNPKTMGQIQREAEQEQYNKQLLNFNTNMGGGSNSMSGNNNRKDNRNDRNDRNDRSRNDSRTGSTGNYNNNSNYNKASRGGGYQDADGWQSANSKNRGGSNNTSVDTTKFKGKANIDNNTSLGGANQFRWNQTIKPPQESETHKNIGLGNRSKELYYSKGSMERERYDGPGSRGGSQHGSRENSAARNQQQFASRSLHQPSSLRSTMPFNNSPSSTSSNSSQKGSRQESKLSQSQSTSPSPSGGYSSPTSTAQSKEYNDSTKKAIDSIAKTVLTSHQNDEFRKYEDLANAPSLEKIALKDRWGIIERLYYHLAHFKGLNESNRVFIGLICSYWVERKFISKEDYVRGLTEFLNDFEDMAIDVPKVWEWTVEAISVVFKEEVIDLTDLKTAANSLIECNLGGRLLNQLLKYLAYEFGPHFVRDLWSNSKCQWKDFLLEDDSKEFIKNNKLEFVENPKASLPVATTKLSADKLIKRVHEFLHAKKSHEIITDYLKLHSSSVNKLFIRLLTRELIEHSFIPDLKHLKLDESAFKVHITLLLKGYVEDNEELSMECLLGVQTLVNELEHPSGLLPSIFSNLFDEDVIAGTVFKAWRDYAEEPQGKGVALKNLRTFFELVDDDVEEDDNEEVESSGSLKK